MSVKFTVFHDPDKQIRSLQLDMLVQHEDGDYEVSEEDGRQIEQLTDGGWCLLATDFDQKQMLFEKKPAADELAQQGDDAG